MALKRQITKAEHTALTDALKTLYIADSSGETFNLDVTGFDDVPELRRAHDRGKEELRVAKEATATEKMRADGLQGKLDALGPDAKEKLKDITVLEKSWSDKLTKE